MDRQEKKLRDELAGTGVGVYRDGDNITLNMPGNVTFATNSADLNAEFFSVLTSVSKVMTEFDQTVVEVAGHTDSTGSNVYNLGLSERRAESVAQYLRTQGCARSATDNRRHGRRHACFEQHVGHWPSAKPAR